MPLKKNWRFLFWLYAFLSSGALFCVQDENSPGAYIEHPQKSTAPVQNINSVRSPMPKDSAEASGSPASNGVKKQPGKLVLDKNLLKPVPEDPRAGDPMVLLELFPWVREINRWIPRRFSLAEHDVILDPNQIVIRHQFANARSLRAQKNAILTLSYAGSLGRGMNTQVEMPLFYSPAIGLFGWERYPFGNYTMTILRGSSVGGEIYLRALTRF